MIISPILVEGIISKVDFVVGIIADTSFNNSDIFKIYIYKDK